MRRNILTINGRSPGPTIQVNIGTIFLHYKILLRTLFLHLFCCKMKQILIKPNLIYVINICVNMLILLTCNFQLFSIATINTLNKTVEKCNLCKKKFIFQACLGDTIEIFVHNKLDGDELAIHWHGIRQKGYNHMDGVSMITQCPILPFSSFLYKFNPDKAGTYFYHAHSGNSDYLL